MHKCLKLIQRSSVVPTNKNLRIIMYSTLYVHYYIYWGGGGGGGGGGEGMHDRRSTAVPIAPLNTVHYLG